MAKQAKYTIHVPTTSNTGEPLRDLAQAAHDHLHQSGVIEGSFIERGKIGNWRNYAPEVMDHLVTFAEDSPETDSHLKQAGVHIADMANQEAITVTKESAAGPALWIVNNPGWREGEGAHPAALEQPTAGQLHSEWPDPPVDSPLASPKARRASVLDYLTSGASLAN